MISGLFRCCIRCTNVSFPGSLTLFIRFYSYRGKEYESNVITILIVSVPVNSCVTCLNAGNKGWLQHLPCCASNRGNQVKVYLPVRLISVFLYIKLTVYLTAPRGLFLA